MEISFYSCERTTARIACAGKELHLHFIQCCRRPGTEPKHVRWGSKEGTSSVWLDSRRGTRLLLEVTQPQVELTGSQFVMFLPRTGKIQGRSIMEHESLGSKDFPHQLQIVLEVWGLRERIRLGSYKGQRLLRTP